MLLAPVNYFLNNNLTITAFLTISLKKERFNLQVEVFMMSDVDLSIFGQLPSFILYFIQRHRYGLDTQPLNIVLVLCSPLTDRLIIPLLSCPRAEIIPW